MSITTPPLHRAIRRNRMTVIPVQSAKFGVVFPEGRLPRIDPNRPEFILDLDGCKIQARISPKAARKLAVHQGGAILSGRLIVENGRLVLDAAGFQWMEKKAEEIEVSQPAADFSRAPR
jgi:hypothetical protein